MKSAHDFVQTFAVDADGWHFETDEDARRHDDALVRAIEARDAEHSSTRTATSRGDAVEAALAVECEKHDAPKGYGCAWAKGPLVDDNLAFCASRIRAASLPTGDTGLRGALEALAAIGGAIASQDNRCTALPVFVVQRRKRTYGFDPAYTEDSVAWLYADEAVEVPGDEAAALAVEYDETGVEPEGFIRTAYVDSWEYVMPFFTEAAAQRYIDENKHNLTPEARIYAESGYRNPEWESIRRACVAARAALSSTPPVVAENATTAPAAPSRSEGEGRTARDAVCEVLVAYGTACRERNFSGRIEALAEGVNAVVAIIEADRASRPPGAPLRATGLADNQGILHDCMAIMLAATGKQEPYLLRKLFATIDAHLASPPPPPVDAGGGK